MPSRLDEVGAVEAKCARPEHRLRPLVGHLDIRSSSPAVFSCCIERWSIAVEVDTSFEHLLSQVNAACVRLKAAAIATCCQQSSRHTQRCAERALRAGGSTFASCREPSVLGSGADDLER